MQAYLQSLNFSTWLNSKYFLAHENYFLVNEDFEYLCWKLRLMLIASTAFSEGVLYFPVEYLIFLAGN